MKRKLLKAAMPVISPANQIVIRNYYKDEKMLSELHARKVLLLAPHVDDETIGAGGTLMKHAKEGAETHVAFLTDGSGSFTKGEKEALVSARKKEAEKVQELLGLTSIDFYDAKDGQLTSDEPTRAWVRKKIESIQPEVIYAPVFVDCHPDHITTAQLVRDVVDEIQGYSPVIRLYEINTLLPKEEINCIVDISDFVSRKKQTIDVFQSQTIDFDGFLALQHWKTHLLGDHKVEAVETFLELSHEELKNRFDRLDGRYKYSDHFKQANKEATLLYAMFKNLKFKEKVYEESRS
ncbi:PIG-L deacetylase family protein [Halobacillus yeomjeoni]|uniref:PIG-L family deacetylase n=1 Tax=Halobacillus yeomjeoni TaxID=311194 RepID=A0A931HW10_9BACI|nr:PIG-L deacetylase family protein [Halobacillus yeomjeoni]MBH0230707.1 PIG-L family deacetylase [Halobacillus yeomjeoni]